KINNQDDRDCPQQHDREQHAVGEQQARGTASSFALVHQIEIAENSKQDEGDSQLQAFSRKLQVDVSRERVERIRHHGGGRHDRNQLVQEIGAVLRQTRAMVRGVLAQEDQLVASLAERNKQRQQRGADDQPGGNLHMDDHTAAQDPKNKSCRDHKHVQEHHVLQQR